MRVIQLTTHFHPSVGGVERQAEEIAVHLKELGHDVQVFTTDAVHGRSQNGRLQRLFEIYRGLEVKRFRYLISAGAFFRFAPGLIWAILTTPYDVVHLHNIHDAHLIPVLLINLIKRKKLIITGHNPFVVDETKRSAMMRVLVKFHEFWVMLLRFGVYRYIALLPSERQEVMRRFHFRAHKVVVVPNGIQDIYYQGEGNADHFYKVWGIDRSQWKLVVGTASRLHFVKGIQNLENAVKNLPKILFVFAGGDDGYYQTLKRIYGTCDNVIFTERYLPSEEVKDFYAAMDLFLLPSVYEPFGMTLVEAMAQGKIVLSSDVGGPAEIVSSEYGELIPPTEQDKWTQRLRYYMQHPDEIKLKEAAARRVATKYQWSNVIKQIEATYLGKI